MQTFLPSSDFAECARVLDRQRLGKQRVETMQILKALIHDSGWRNHPATKMWRGHEGRLAEYNLAICDEWTARGYKDTCRDKTLALLADAGPTSYDDPAWMGDPAIHASHRSNLLRKDPEFYSQFGWTESDDLDYVWPV